jgi:hypothetical protein
MSKDQPRSSRQQYRRFVEDYKNGRLDAVADGDGRPPGGGQTAAKEPRARGFRAFARGSQRRYLSDYFRWLRPH